MLVTKVSMFSTHEPFPSPVFVCSSTVKPSKLTVFRFLWSFIEVALRNILAFFPPPPPPPPLSSVGSLHSSPHLSLFLLHLPDLLLSAPAGVHQTQAGGGAAAVGDPSAAAPAGAGSSHGNSSDDSPLLAAMVTSPPTLVKGAG